MAEPVILYDGACVFCSASMRLVHRLDRRGRFRFAAIASPAGSRLLARHGFPPGFADSIVLIEDGRALIDSAAVLVLFAALPATALPARALRALLPRRPLDRLYRWVAARRYRIAGRRPACPAPDAAFRARMLPDGF
ncbi:MAG TPA: DCC1-like thiol-disulfide oxidoreductase family protein [Alphaproteobacteria bacterium]|nr:DCC1-like thiol-disulfide oxidoreductase family protein [Alphaproteobacteria bacterium]